MFCQSPRHVVLATCLAFVLAAPTANAQTTAAPIAPKDPLRIDLLGPAQWRTQFGPTNVGTLLASEAGAAIWKGYVMPFEGMVKNALGLDDAAYAEARARLLDYGGAITITFDFDGEDEGLRVAFGPDGRTDLPTLCKDLATMAARFAGSEWSDEASAPAKLQIGEEQFVSKPTITGTDPTDQTATFAVSGDAGLNAAHRAAEPLGAELRARAGEKALRPPFRMRFDVQATIAAADGTPDTGTNVMLGIAALREFDLSLGAAGPQAQVEASMRFDGTDRGIFAFLFPDADGLPAIASLRPADIAFWKTGRCDFSAIRTVVRSAAEKTGSDAAEIDEQMPPAIFDPQNGLLSHFTNEYALASTAQSLEDLEANQSNFVFAVRIRDHVAFADKWNAARKELGFTELSSEERDGFVVQRLGGLVAVTTALGPDMLALGYGRDAGDAIDAWIEKAKDGAWTKSKPPMPQGLSRAAPAGCNGAAEGQVAMVLSQVLAMSSLLPLVVGNMDLDFDPEEIDVEAVQQLLKAHNLDIARSLTGYRDGVWRMRVFW